MKGKPLHKILVSQQRADLQSFIPKSILLLSDGEP